jgi:hypothetical protein
MWSGRGCFSNWNNEVLPSAAQAAGRAREGNSLNPCVLHSGDKKEGAMDVVYRRCAGLDVHKQSISACVMISGPGEEPASVEKRTFGTYTSESVELQHWLSRCLKSFTKRRNGNGPVSSASASGRRNQPSLPPTGWSLPNHAWGSPNAEGNAIRVAPPAESEIRGEGTRISNRLPPPIP